MEAREDPTRKRGSLSLGDACEVVLIHCDWQELSLIIIKYPGVFHDVFN